MTGDPEPIQDPAQQLYDVLGYLHARLHGLGLAVTDPGDPIAEARLAYAAGDLADQLDQDGPSAVRAAVEVVTLLFPHGTPERVGEARWWMSPIGRLCARALAPSETSAVTYREAALMLGVRKGTVGVMASRGTLVKHPDGGIARSSVLARIGRDMPTWEPPPATVTLTVEPGITEPGITFTRQGVTYWRF